MNPFALEEMAQITPPPFAQKPGAYYSLEAAARRNTTPLLTRLRAWLTNRPDEALDESTGGREMLSPDVFYKQAIEAPARQRPGGYDWLDSLAHTLTSAMVMRGGVEIPEWARGHPMIKRYGALKERGILNEAEYEQGIKEQIAKLGSMRERMTNTEPSSVIAQLERMAKTGAQQTDAGPPVEALPLISPRRVEIPSQTQVIRDDIPQYVREAELHPGDFAPGPTLARRERPRTVAPTEFPTEAQGWSVADNPVLGARIVRSELGPYDMPMEVRVGEFQRRFPESGVSRSGGIPPRSISADSPDWWMVLADDILERAHASVSTRQVDVDREVGRYIASLFGVTVRDGMRVFRDFSRNFLGEERGSVGDILERVYGTIWRVRR